jgi:hypothetical protein
MYHVWGKRGVYRVLVGKNDGKHVEDLDVDGRLLLGWIFRK